MNTTEQEVLDLVARWANTELTGDVDAYTDLPAEDFVGVGPVGFVLDGEQWAQRHRGGLKN
jgi:ketosteroid isomerase-like protein